MSLLACMNAQAQRKVKLKVLEKGTEQPVIAATVVYADNEALAKPAGERHECGRAGGTENPLQENVLLQNILCRFCSGNRKDRSDRNREDRLSGRGSFGTERGSRHRFAYSATHQDVARYDASLGRPSQLVEAGYSNLQQALQQETPGLNIQKVGFGNEISMQGLDARHVLFLMDGERMTGDMAGNLDYERFNCTPSTVSRL